MKHKLMTFFNKGSLQPGTQILHSPWPALKAEQPWELLIGSLVELRMPS